MHGFLPFSRASFMLDVVTVSLVVVVPLLTTSLALVRRGRHYRWHRNLQTGMGLALLIVVILFEIEIRLYGWKPLASPSPYYDTWLFPLLYFHVVCATSATVTWTLTIIRAWRRFPNPPRPSAHSHQHKRHGLLAAALMYVTSVTGWVFYWMAFVAT